MNIVFFGSSEFSIPVLSSLLDFRSAILVITIPPKRKGRGQRETKSVVSDWARSRSIRCIAPDDIRASSFIEALKKEKPDYLVVASFGKILPDTLLKIPIKFPLNVHPSLLPKYRGASPIAYQLLNGEANAGVTIAKITDRLDAGEIFTRQQILIADEDNAETLSVKLAKLGGDLLCKTISQIENKNYQLTSQDEQQASYASKLCKEMGKIDWSLSATQIHNQIRAFVSWPSAHTLYQGRRIKILKSELDQTVIQAVSGTILKLDANGAVIQTGSGTIKILTIQPESGKPMSAYAFSLGHGMKVGDRFE